jgi:hypothetical protein
MILGRPLTESGEPHAPRTTYRFGYRLGFPFRLLARNLNTPLWRVCQGQMPCGTILAKPRVAHLDLEPDVHVVGQEIFVYINTQLRRQVHQAKVALSNVWRLLGLLFCFCIGTD